MNRLLLILFFLCTPTLLEAQKPLPNFDLAKENTAQSLLSRYNPRKVVPCWLNCGVSFLYAVEIDTNICIFNVDVSKNQKTKIEVKPSKSNNFTYKSKNYTFNPFSKKIIELADKTSDRREAGTSPNQKYEVFAKNHNLFISDTEQQTRPTQLTTDGEKFYSFNGDIDYNFTNELFRNDTSVQPPSITWSPNSDFFIAMRTDARMLKDSWVNNSISNPRPGITAYKQRNPGEPATKNEVWIFQVEKKRFFKVDLKKWKNEVYWDFGWSKNGEYIFIQRLNKEQNKCDVLRVGKNGNAKILIEERPGANIYPHTFQELSGEKYLWFSRRDGWGHLYLYDGDGSSTQLTTGNYNVEKVVGVDSLSANIFFMANGREEGVNPYYSLLYSVDIKTKKVKLLTPENADHEVSLSPDYKSFVDVFSRVNMPHQSQLRTTDGKLLMELEVAKVSKLEKSGWANPEIFKVKAADSITDLWGVMWKPFDFDPQKKYPIISYVYPGPQSNFVPTEFFTQLNNAHLAQYGFVVVMCDTRGSSYQRSKEFSEYYRTNLRDYPLADNKYMIEQLADKQNFIDISKVGIWGGSSGGFMAASAMLTYPDFYKVCVSRAGQHDPNVFHAWWSDLFNTPINKNEPDTIYTNLSLAKNLKGKLLIIHGEADMNVHPSNSARLANELMKAGKYFDYLIFPGGGHGWSSNWQYEQKRIWLYFVENLMGYKIENINIFDY